MFVPIWLIVVGVVVIFGIGAWLGWRERDRQARRKFESTLTDAERANLKGFIAAGGSTWKDFRDTVKAPRV